MSKLGEWETFAEGDGQFLGSVRGADENAHSVFAVRLSKHPSIQYGSFTRKRVDNSHFYVEIESVGYGHASNVGNTSPGARASFEPAEVEALKALTENLFLSEGKKPFPLSLKDAFTRRIDFQEGWIRKK
jgi:hypothetical protein